ncbi:MAG: hypothetical protein J6R73_03165 [Alistipes sp.]|nr:hypothetical protein [Alistipes sp.]
MQRVGRIVLLTLMWVAVVAYILYAASLSRAVRRSMQVQGLEIVVADSTARGSLFTATEVRQWITRSGLLRPSMSADSVDLTALERLVLRNGFVAEAEVSINREGQLRLVLSQRKPIVRLLSERENSYVTSEGYLFAVPRRSALYVPVVTGSYRPPVPLRYEGSVREQIDRECWKIDTLIASLERSKYPFYAAERQNDRRLRDVRRMRTSKRWWKLESEEEFEERVEELRAIKAGLRRKYRYEGRRIEAEIERIAARQEHLREEQKKLEKKYEDFMKLLTFVEQLEKDDFWGSEVVEIIAQTAPSGALELQLVPRSGRFTIAFGRIERVEEKFAKLERFYRDGLSVVGWERYRVLDVRFSNQVVCR